MQYLQPSSIPTYALTTYVYKNYLHKPDFVLFQQFGTMYCTLATASHEGWCHLIPAGSRSPVSCRTS